MPSHSFAVSLNSLSISLKTLVVATVPVPNTARVIGYDVARSLAIGAMMIVHFCLVMAADRQHPIWLANLPSLLDGRATAVFVILAGIGVTLGARRAIQAGDREQIAVTRWKLIRRGLMLLVFGYGNLIIWPGDILRVYGISLFIAAYALSLSNRGLLLGAALFEVGFIVLMFLVDFTQNWNFETMTYHGTWASAGIIRNLFYDGFRSVFPWTGVLMFGMWLGRQDLRDRASNNRALLAGGVSWIVAEVISKLTITYFLAHPESLDEATAKFLFGTESMPALPLFLMSSCGAAVLSIAVCVRLTEKSPSPMWQPLVATGKMALTWYVVHILFGLGTIVMLELVTNQPLLVAAITGVSFFLFAVLTSWIWKRSFQHGPLERLVK